MTATASAPAASSARKAEKRLAAASARSPVDAEVDIAPACSAHGPEGQQRFALAHLAGLEPEAGRRRVVPRQHARRGGLPRLALGQRDPTGPARVRCSRARGRPSRKTTGSAPVTSTTVDSSPIGAGPPSRIMATRSPKSASTCAAVVGLTWPERLALGAATGRPAARSSACATGCAGHAQCDGVEPRGRQLCHRTTILLGHHERQRARPERGCQLPAGIGEAAEPGGGIRIRHVHDQRIEVRPSLGGKDRRDRPAIGRVRPEPVHGLGRERDEGAVAQRRASGRNRLACCLENRH